MPDSPAAAAPEAPATEAPVSVAAAPEAAAPEPVKLDPKRFDLTKMSIRDVVNARLAEIGKRPSYAAAAGSSEAVVYRFLKGEAETNSENVAAMLKRCGLVIRAAPGFKPPA